MKKNFCLKAIGLILLCALIGSGCAKHESAKDEVSAESAAETMEEVSATEPETEADRVSPETEPEPSTESLPAEPEIVDADWGEYFDGLNGTAVIYEAAAQRYTVYNRELALTRRPPCSTFKIISSLIALEIGILEPENSVRAWSGEVFWNDDWNRDINFGEAFRTSCVWYYRQLIDEIGAERMQTELNRLSYGNCDISDWEGRLNTDNPNRALTGFWIESSLAISPKQQTEVMGRIFGENSDYSPKTQEELKRVMLVSNQEGTDPFLLYGKTGLGTVDGLVADAWFTGFAERAEGNLYFCVRLGPTDGREVSSSLAREIALRLIADSLG